MWIVGLPPHSRWLVHESFCPQIEPSTGRAYNRLQLSLSISLIKISAQVAAGLSLLLGGVRPGKMERGARLRRFCLDASLTAPDVTCGTKWEVNRRSLDR